MSLATETIMVTPEIKRGRNQLAVTVVLGHAVKHIFNSSLQVILLPVIKDDMALSGAQFGLLSMVGRLASGGTTMIAGYLGDRFANRSGLMLFISLGLMGTSYFILGSAPNYWILLAIMFFVGIGPSLYHPPAIASLSRKFPDKRGFAISLHGTGGSVGEVVGPILTGALLTLTYFAAFSWRDILHISVVPAFGFAIAVYLMMRNIPAVDSGTESAKEYFSSLVNLLKQRSMLILVLVTGLRSMGQSAVVAFLPVYLLQDLGYSPAVIGLYMAGAQVAGIFAQPLMGYLSDRFGRKIVLVPAMAVLGLLYIVLNFAEPGIQLVLTILAMGAFLYSLHTIFIAAALDVSKGKSQSTVVSLIYGASFLGIVSPLIAGILADNFGTGSAFIYAGAVALASTVLLAMQKLPKTANQIAEGN